MSTPEEGMRIATKIAKAIEGKLVKQVAVVRLIELKDFPHIKYIELSFKPVGTSSAREVATAYSWQFFTNEKTDINFKAKRIYEDVKALLGLE